MKLAVMECLLAGADDEERFELARRLGVDGVEVVVHRAQLASSDPPRLRQLQQARARTGLRIPSLVLLEHNGGGVASEDPAVGRAARDDIRRAIEWAPQLGTKVILVPFFGRGEIVTDADFQRAVEAFRELCPVAHQQGIRLGLESTLPAGRIRQMAAEIGSEAFACYFDLANVVWRGMDTATEIRALGPLICQVHMKDCRVCPGDCRPGRGQVNFRESVRALREVRFNGWVVLETPSGPRELIERDISFTRRVFPRLRSREPWPRLGAFANGFGRGDVDRLVDAFRAAGLGWVQLSDQILLDALEQPEDVRARLEAGGIRVAGLAGYRNLVAPDEMKRRAHLAHLKRCLEVAPRLGTSVVATETGTLHPDSDWVAVPENRGEAAWRALESALAELLPVAEKSGSILALEGYVNNVLATHGQVIGLLEKFPTEHLQLMLDPYNYLSSHLLPARERITTAFLHRFESRFVLAHLKDTGPEGAEVSTPEFGTGVFPQELYLEFLRTERPDLPLILEHLPFDHIPAAIERLRTMRSRKRRGRERLADEK